jgi:hypothetical protein
MQLLILAEIISQQPATVFVVMTIRTEIFPIRSIRGIIRMVSIFMVDCQEMQVGCVKFATAFGAYPSVELQGLLPVRLHSGAFRPHPADQFIGFFPGECLYGAGSAGGA